ncbi:polysaccharide deacetylase family protein [Alkalibacillus aidingensis]|uniref:polysaccharide deacetylase family protein n=1 Tax=Alkalibacillus aidingensis TaxID=2747607 RepID=UPI0016617389|nr:polysaccharide deacetylase family protein [Alkalibacillus aidingensis]
MFFALNWTRLKKVGIVICLMVLFYLSVHFSSLVVLNVGADSTPSGAITKSLKGEREISLTFNVMWGDDVIVDILDVLQQQNTKATFFINGEWALRNEDIAELIIEENHEVGLLGFKGDPYEDQSTSYIEEDIQNGVTVLSNLDYDPLSLVRPPENEYNQMVIDTIQQLGYQTVFWSVYANVKHDSDPEEVSNHLIQEVDEGDIVLFFAQDNLTATPEIVERLIKQKKEDEYQFYTISELLSPADVELNPLE